MEENNGFIFLAGIGIVLLFTIVFGVPFIIETLNHIKEDLTKDLGIHIYIAGFILIVIGFYRAFRMK